jgi:tripartite motif-containing protein 71
MTRRLFRKAMLLAFSFLALTALFSPAAVVHAATPPPLLYEFGFDGTEPGAFYRPYGVAVDTDDYIYVTDTGNNCVQKFTSTGEFVATWGSVGSGSDQFNRPIGIAVDSYGYIYVADVYNYRVQKLSPSGEFVASWGSYGTAEGQFNLPYGVAVGSDGNVYVADAANDRVQVFDSDGGFIAAWGSLGSGEGEFNFPSALATDAAGNVYVCDNWNHRVQVFDSDGGFIAEWGTEGGGDGQFYRPVGIAVSAAGDIYVTDGYNRVQKFDSDYNYISTFGGGLNMPMGVAVDSESNVYVVDYWNNRVVKYGAETVSWGLDGTGEGQLQRPSGITIDSQGYIFIADTLNNRVQKFTSTGEFVAAWGTEGTDEGQFRRPWGIAVDASDNVYVTEVLGNRVQVFSSEGEPLSLWSYSFNMPQGIAVDASGYVYVGDYNSLRKFDSSGAFMQQLASYGTDDGQVRNPGSVAVDDSGNVFVADTYNHRVQKFDSSGSFVTKWGTQGTSDGEFNMPGGIALDSQGNVYVADTNNNRMQAFTPDGEHVVSWGGPGGPFYLPIAAAFDAHDNIFVLDNAYDPLSPGNNRVHVFSCAGLVPSAPALIGAETDESGALITLTLSKVMADPAGKQGQFTYSVNGGEAQGFSAAALDSDYTRIVLTMGGAAIAYGDTVTIGYTAGDVEAADGGALGSFADQPVTNNVTPPPPDTPEVLLSNLIEEVSGMGEANWVKSSLTPKLEAAHKVLTDDNTRNDVAAVNALKAFINSVEAQRGKKIAQGDAGTLIADAQKIMEALSGGK